MIFRLELTEQQLNIIATALGKQPFDTVADLIINVIGKQVAAQKAIPNNAAAPD